jgi:hypothetical protein
MYLRIAAMASITALTGLLAACDVAVVNERPRPIVVERSAPYYIDEGAPYNGVVIAPYEANDYVFVGNSYYYYHPAARTWVRVNHGRDWHPRRGAHVYHRWDEHPQYHRY